MMRPISKAGADLNAERGYTYVAVLIVLVALAMGAQVAAIPAKSALIRNDEAELLFRGQAYVAAIDSYRNAIEGDKSLPQKLEDLLDDRRAGRRRHIRRLYSDPLTGGAWKVLRNPEGQIHGVVSNAPGTPRKKAFFPAGLARFASAKTYASWEFVYKDKASKGN